MKNKSILLFCICIFVSPLFINAQGPHYTYNNKIVVKQGASLAKLKNPFVGGFELPQFSAIDLNLDGIMDLLVFDKGTKKFYTFINDGIADTVSYTYAPQYEAKLPPSNNFCLTYDYNNDGKMDLLVEAGGAILQYKNTSTTSLSFKSPDTLNNFDKFNIFCPPSNIPSFQDIDNDGDMDILTWDPYGFTILLYKNWRVEKGLTNDQWDFKLADECWGKFFLDNSLHLGFHCTGITTWPNGDDYTPPPTPTGYIKPLHFGSTLLTLDMDSDGDYEALLGDIYNNYLYFLKNGKKEFNYPKDTMIAFDSLYPSPTERFQVENFPSAYFLDVDNDGKRDIIVAPNDAGGDSKNKNQILFYKNIGTDRKPIFKFIQNNFLSETTIDLGGDAVPAFVDIDNDGDDDLFIATHGEFTQTSNTHDVIVYYKNTGTQMNPVFELQDTDFLNLSAKNYSWLTLCFGDLNGDGKKDLLLGENNGLLKYYVNTSSGGTISFTENTTQFASFHDLDYPAPFLVDYDRDGKLDLFLGNYDGTIEYFKNTGTVISPVFTKMIDSVGKICVRSIDDTRMFTNDDGRSIPVVADLNNDGKFDLLVGGKNGIYIFNNIEGKLNDSLLLRDAVVRFSPTQLPVQHFTGLYAAPAIAQLDSDNYYDIMVGNNGGGVSVFSTWPPALGIHLLSISINKLHITPNPSSNTITIEGFESEIISMMMYDETGKEITFQEKYNKLKPILNISQLQQGVYFITIISKNGESYNGKFVKM